jgi:hypothetical protein
LTNPWTPLPSSVRNTGRPKGIGSVPAFFRETTTSSTDREIAPGHPRSKSESTLPIIQKTSISFKTNKLILAEGGKQPTTASGGNFVGRFLNRSKRAAQWAVLPRAVRENRDYDSAVRVRNQAPTEVAV